jgi:hypothetical protein
MEVVDTPVADPAHQQAFRAATQQLQSGRSTTTAVLTLTSAGVNEKDATDFVIAANKRITEAKRKQASRDILYGSLWCGGGLIVTMVTYGMATGGGSYMVAWGAIIFGAIQLFRGLANQR